MGNPNTKQIQKEEYRRIRAAALHDLVHGRAVYVLAFIVPLIIMVAVYVIRSIFPFGESCYLRSDMYHQYCPFFSELWEKIRTGGSLEYTWDIGLGSNFVALYGYYLSSPSNWFIALFPQEYMIEIMNAIILLKLAGSSLSFTYYICKHNNKTHLSAAIFGLFYALSGYTAAFSWNLMWLDCVMLLPLVILGLERLVKEGKGLVYAVALGFSILSNYYIAIMVCISCVIYFVITMISMPVPEKKTYYIKATVNFAVYSLLAGGLAAVILLPEVFALEYTASGSIKFPETLNRYFSLITVFQRHLINTEVSTGLDHMPNIYCGVMILVLLPLYITTTKIKQREKISKVVALIIFLTAFNMNIPNFIWHGFHYPNSLPCRQSFIYVFLILSMGYDALKNIKSIKSPKIAGCFWGAIIFLLYLGTVIDDYKIEFENLYITALFIALYTLAIYIYKSKKINNCLLTIIVFAIAITECTINVENTGYSTTSRTYYHKDREAVETLMNEIAEKDDSFYRTSKIYGYRSKNDSAWHNYKGASVFSSTTYSSITEIYGQLGLEHSMNAWAVNGATPLVYSMLDIKYLLSNTKLQDSPLTSLEKKVDNMYLYKNNYTLPLGFMIPSNLGDKWAWEEENNPFIVQNSFAESAAGIKDLFTPVSFVDKVKSATITVTEDCYVFVHSQNKSIKTLAAQINGSKTTYGGINHGRTVDLGYLRAGTTVEITDNDDEAGSLQLYVYTMNVDKFKQLYESLADEGLKVTDYDDTHIKGTITALEDGMCFTSIPYDEGYTVYVDGIKTSYTTTGGAFISFPVSSGTHTVEMKYDAEGFNTGIAITTICALILIACLVFRIKFKKEISETGSIELIIESLVESSKNSENKTTNNTNKEARN